MDEKGLKSRRFLTKVFKRLESICKHAEHDASSVLSGACMLMKDLKL